MKFMILLKATTDTEAGIMPDAQLLKDMTDYNEQLLRAGVLIGGEGLHPTGNGAKVQFDGATRQVIRGPFAIDPAHLVAGFWIFQTTSLEEAVEWVKRCPNPTGQQAEIEIRRIFTADDFGPAMSDDIRAREDRMRDALDSRPG